MKLFLAVALGIAFGVALIPYVARLLAAAERHGPTAVARALPVVGVLALGAVLVAGGIAAWSSTKAWRERRAGLTRIAHDSTRACAGVKMPSHILSGDEWGALLEHEKDGLLRCSSYLDINPDKPRP